jgi:hypothetical protein
MFERAMLRPGACYVFKGENSGSITPQKPPKEYLDRLQRISDRISAMIANFQCFPDAARSLFNENLNEDAIYQIVSRLEPALQKPFLKALSGINAFHALSVAADLNIDLNSDTKLSGKAGRALTYILTYAKKHISDKELLDALRNPEDPKLIAALEGQIAKAHAKPKITCLRSYREVIEANLNLMDSVYEKTNDLKKAIEAFIKPENWPSEFDQVVLQPETKEPEKPAAGPVIKIEAKEPKPDEEQTGLLIGQFLAGHGSFVWRLEIDGKTFETKPFKANDPMSQLKAGEKIMAKVVEVDGKEAAELIISFSRETTS